MEKIKVCRKLNLITSLNYTWISRSTPVFFSVSGAAGSVLINHYTYKQWSDNPRKEGCQKILVDPEKFCLL